MKVRKFILVSFLLLVIRPGFGQTTPVDSILNILENQPERILITAHRGGHLHVPENSVATIDEAIAEGASIVETDVRETKDGILVMLHDRELDRTTTGKGNLADLTYAEIQQFYLLYEGKPTKYKIPTFKEYLAYAKDRIVLDIDFKLDGIDAIERAYEMIEEMGMEKQVIFYLYDYTQIENLYHLNPEIRIMARAYKEEDIENIMQIGKVAIIHIDPSFKMDGRVKLAQEAGYRIWINSLGLPDKMSEKNSEVFNEFLQKYHHANIIQTDYPGRLLEVISQ